MVIFMYFLPVGAGTMADKRQTDYLGCRSSTVCCWKRKSLIPIIIIVSKRRPRQIFLHSLLGITGDYFVVDVASPDWKLVSQSD